MAIDITKTPIIGGVVKDIQRTVNNVLDSSNQRLRNVGLNPGGATTAARDSVAQARFKTEDRRARLSLSPGSGNILYRDPSSGLLNPLLATDGVVWPYTPTINTAYTASYATNNLAHTNYTQVAYNYSSIDNITVVGQFTANTPSEAAYMLAVINFFRAASKMFYGQDQLRGTPPPVLRFSAYGPNMFNSVPVVISTFSQDFEGGVDYIEASSIQYAGDEEFVDQTLVPTLMTINVTLLPVVTRRRTTEFSLQRYARGELIGDKNGVGGMP